MSISISAEAASPCSQTLQSLLFCQQSLTHTCCPAMPETHTSSQVMIRRPHNPTSASTVTRVNDASWESFRFFWSATETQTHHCYYALTVTRHFSVQLTQPHCSHSLSSAGGVPARRAHRRPHCPGGSPLTPSAAPTPAGHESAAAAGSGGLACPASGLPS